MGLLLSMDIKGLVKPKEGATESSHDAGQAQMPALSLQSISETAKEGLNASIAEEITALEAKLNQAPASGKLAIQKQLAEKWDDVNQPAPQAFYYQMIAAKDSTYANWLKTGDLFAAAYQSAPDTLVQPALTQKAIDAYQKALALQPNSLDAKTGLGVAYVSGTGNPMQGIQLLLGVVKEDPENVKANYNLGLFSMRSGQFDKAVNRFKTVIAKQPDPESWFYLATSYENLGQKQEAILAFQKSKELAADPNLSKFVDKKVEELKK
jgi:tetratricopeptide (TPR) repeat protein